MNGNALRAVTAALSTKAQKEYAPGTILIIEYHGWQLDDGELRAVAQHARTVAPGFREVWVYADAQETVKRATCDY